VTTLVEMVHLLDESLDAADIPHAFGGALALAYCIGDPRATADIDLNVFLPPEQVEDLLDALPRGLSWDDGDRELLERDGQARLWWERTPIDVFLNTTDFHQGLMKRSRREELAGRDLPFLSCDDLAVFKTFFNRRRDWADLEAMVISESFDVERAIGVLVTYLGADDPRVEGLVRLIDENSPGSQH
jgi:hypothetical protein